MFLYSLLLSLTGLVPDIDALLHVHRWATHSIVVSGALFLILYLVFSYRWRGLLRYVALAHVLYTLHIVTDMFTAPTPVLWPLVRESYMVYPDATGQLGPGGLVVYLNTSIVSVPTDFSPREYIEGPIVSPTGAVLLVATAAVLAIERVCPRVCRG